MTAPLAAILLCGGRSTRMGRPKASLPFGREPLLARVVRLLGGPLSPLIVVAAPDQPLPPLDPPTPDLHIARDPEEGHGPLQGLLAGLDALLDHRALAPADLGAAAGGLHAAALRVNASDSSAPSHPRAPAAAAFLCAVDAPFASPLLALHLEALRRAGGFECAVPTLAGRIQPLAGVYTTPLRDRVAALLASGERRLTLVAERSHTLLVDEPTLLSDPALRAADPHLWCLRNINAPAEYERALRDAGLPQAT